MIKPNYQALTPPKDEEELALLLLGVTPAEEIVRRAIQGFADELQGIVTTREEPAAGQPEKEAVAA